IAQSLRTPLDRELREDDARRPARIATVRFVALSLPVLLKLLLDLPEWREHLPLPGGLAAARATNLEEPKPCLLKTSRRGVSDDLKLVAERGGSNSNSGRDRYAVI